MCAKWAETETGNSINILSRAYLTPPPSPSIAISMLFVSGLLYSASVSVISLSIEEKDTPK